MKKTPNFRLLFALFLTAAAPLAATAQTTFFSDNFSSSTLNQPVTSPTGTSTSYETAFGIAGGNSTSSISPHDLSLTLPNSASVLGEVFGLFTNKPVPLTTNGDYLAITVVFINTSNILSGLDGANSTINLGLFNSGGVAPNQGNITLNTGGGSGGTQHWLGYDGRIFWSGKPSVFTRPSQTSNGTTSQNEDLLFNNASSSQSFINPVGTTLGSPNATTNITLTIGSTYTMQFVISFASPTSLSISNALYAGVGTGGTQLFCMTNLVATNATFLTGGFDGLAVGWRNSSTASQASTMDISSIQITGQSTPVTVPPTITLQPVSVTVPNGGSCAFSVNTIGFGQVYQWHRNGTNLLDGGNISGSTQNLLVISPAGPADVFSGANGYYVTITGDGGYSTNSVTNSLALTTATNLIWTGLQSTWDLNTTAAWQDTNNNTTVFNYGDPVSFTDFGGGGSVTLTGPYLSAASVTVNSGSLYNFNSASSGSFAGPGNLIYIGTGGLTIGNANTYSGGTIISNVPASQGVLLQNLSGLGTGPVTLAKAGGKMEIVPPGSASSAISSDFIVADDFAITFDGLGTYAGDFTGDFSGTVGKTLTFNALAGNTSTNERVRMYSANTTFNANLVLNSSVITLAPYNGTSNQTYNGVISGLGGIIQRGSGTTILNGANTYSGGTTPSAGAIAFGIDTVGAVTSGPIGTGPLYLAPEVAELTGSGTVLASGGAHAIANPIQYPSATNNLTLIIGGANNLTFSGPFTLNGNDGLGTNNIRTIQVTNTSLTTISGVISDGGLGYGLIVTGNGTNVSGPLVLNNTETYTGPTTVNGGGTLQVNGQLNAASAVTVATNGILSGNGTVNGPVTVNAGGTLAPGTTSIGTLTINNSLALNGNLSFAVNKSLSPSQSNDVASVSGTLVNGGTGTLTVANLGPALVVGDKFKLFNKAVSNGSAMTVSGAGVVWANNLQVDGSISVSSTTLPQPVINSIVLQNGTNLVFSGINGTAGSGYSIISSTNITTPLANWVLQSSGVFNGTGGFSYTNIITPGVPAKFLMLRVP